MTTMMIVIRMMIMVMIMVSRVFISLMSGLLHRWADDCITLLNKDYNEDNDDDHYGQFGGGHDDERVKLFCICKEIW